MVETTFASLKTELVYRRAWVSRQELEMEVFSYIEGFYNSRRRHSRLDDLSPLDYEQRYLTRKQVSAWAGSYHFRQVIDARIAVEPTALSHV